MPDTPLNPDALEAALAWFAQAVAEVDVKFADDGTRPGDYWTGYRTAKNEIADLLTEPKLISKAVKAGIAVALPEVTSVEELHQLPSGSIVRASGGSAWKKFGSGWGAWFKAGDSLDYEASIVALPARVLYRPEVNDA